MKPIAEKLEKIEQKLLILIQKYELVNKENTMLIADNMKLKHEIEKYKLNNITQNFEEKSISEKQDISNLNDKTNLKLTLETYIQKIDQCIEELQNI